MMPKTPNTERLTEAAVVFVLVVILFLQLFLSIRQQSQTWDEGDHIYAGYLTWKTGDFGLNPEHPPLAKLLATAPLLPLTLNVPKPEDRFFKEAAFLGGKDFLYTNNADSILIRTRLSVALLTLLCALAVFLTAREMFGKWAAFIALGLFVFDPNILAHGAVVTTDLGLCLFMTLTIYTFYRYAKAPSAMRLLLTGISLGLALSVKHSAVMVIPMLLILTFFEMIRGWLAAKRESDESAAPGPFKLVGGLIAIGLLSIVVLWSFYGFKFAARPEGMSLSPTFAEFTKGTKPNEAWLLNTVAEYRLLPESYLYGMADILTTSYKSYVFETTYPKSVWFYFPVVFAVKSTIGFLGLFILILAAVAARYFDSWREIFFLSVPPLIYLLVAMKSGTNIGVRHILPVYVFLYILAGAAAWALVKVGRKWAVPVAALVLFHVVSSVVAYPHYIPYSNEFWGGSARTYKLLSDSNADWGEHLKWIKTYLDERGVTECSFVYFAAGVAEPAYYGIPCKMLPTVNTLWLNLPLDAPTVIEGTVLISSANLSGFEFGPGKLNPYEQFRHLKPTAIIGEGVFVFDGRFEVPLVAALWRIQNAENLLAKGKNDEALAEADLAVKLAPEWASARKVRGDVLRTLGRIEEARAEYNRGLELAKTIEPEFQEGMASAIERNLAELK